MAKYIIDVPDFDKYNMPSSTKGRVVAIPITICDKTFNIPTEMAFIKPYTEPDHKAIEDEVWETIRKIFTDGTLSGDEDTDPAPFYDCFGEYYFHEVLRKMSYQEAKKKYEAWKKQNGDKAIKQKVIELADEIGVHKLYAIVRDIRGE